MSIEREIAEAVEHESLKGVEVAEVRKFIGQAKELYRIIVKKEGCKYIANHIQEATPRGLR